MPESAAVIAAQADAAMAAREWPTAKALLLRALEIEPNAGRLAYKLGQVQRRLGNRDQARQWLERRSEVAPGIEDPLLLEVASLSMSPKFFMKAGERAWRRGDREEALAAWRNAVALAPGDVDAGLVLAHALGEGGRARCGSDGNPARTRTRSTVGAWLVSSSPTCSGTPATRPTRSTRQPGHWLSMATQPPARFGQRSGCAPSVLAKLPTTTRVLANSLPEDAYVHYWMGMAQLAAGNCPAARLALAKAVRLQPTWGQAHIAQTRADASCGDGEARRSARQRARQLLLANDNPGTRLTLAIAELGLGNANAAGNALTDLGKEVDTTWLNDAFKRNAPPAIPFPPGSDWWLPAEVRP